MKECPTLFLEFHGTQTEIEAQTAAVADIAKGGNSIDSSGQNLGQNWAIILSPQYSCLSSLYI